MVSLLCGFSCVSVDVHSVKDINCKVYSHKVIPLCVISNVSADTLSGQIFYHKLNN